MKNKFLNFHKVICFFGGEEKLSLLNQSICQVVIITNDSECLRVILDENPELCDAVEDKLNDEFVVPYSKINFNIFGLEFSINNDLKLTILGTERMIIVQERAKKVCYSEKVVRIENPL